MSRLSKARRIIHRAENPIERKEYNFPSPPEPGTRRWDAITIHMLKEDLKRAKAENTELKKRLECPKLEWRNEDAWLGGYNIGDITFSMFDEACKGWLFGMEANRESFETEAESKVAVEVAWLEFWNRIHGGSK